MAYASTMNSLRTMKQAKPFRLYPSTSLTWNVVQQLALVMAWSIHAEVKTVRIEYNKIDGVDEEGNNNHSSYGIHQFGMTGKIQKILTAKDMLDFETKYKNAVWSIKLNYSNGLSKVHTVVGNGTQPSLNPMLLDTLLIGTKTETLKIDIKGKFNARLCDKIILVCDINDEDQELTVKEITCIDYAKISQRTSIAKDVSMKVITYTGMGISVIALTVSVIIHRRLGMHVSIPGSNVENLSVALLFSDIAFLIGVGANDNYVVCYVVGILLHYLWLIVFSFKSIALIHMCYTITQMSTNHSYVHWETLKTKDAYLHSLVFPTGHDCCTSCCN
ncbi:unnamed protein product [Mytilus edulis]|uniref:Uncharacterized protein n=1 Tax=Mytilus edulis TaxID=6550 RepID=A0A8S3VKR1_MYTED|nr:unnamed protein product [Mytilus edulis]